MSDADNQMGGSGGRTGERPDDPSEHAPDPPEDREPTGGRSADDRGGPDRGGSDRGGSDRGGSDRGGQGSGG